MHVRDGVEFYRVTRDSMSQGDVEGGRKQPEPGDFRVLGQGLRQDSA